MPIHTFKCSTGHKTEKIFLTFAEAQKTNHIYCPTCRTIASKVEFEVPYPAHFHGNPSGYHKPSPTKRESYKLINKHGNDHRPPTKRPK